MEAFLSFFEQMPSWQKFSWIIICLMVSWVLEGSIPLTKLNYKKWKHAGVNLVFLSTSILINLIFGVLTVGIFIWTASNQFGLLYLIDLPIWAELLLTVMLFDFIAQYVAHVMLHKYSWMWRFHMVHHSDMKVDATTGTRHHPGDYMIREVYALFTIVITGAPVAYYIFYRIVTIFFTYFSHANIAIPNVMDRVLNLVFVTPNMHKFHHHFERPWTDSNYGNIFSLWDRMFGTLVYEDPKQVVYGLDVLEGKDDESVMYQFKIPFDKTIKTDTSS